MLVSSPCCLSTICQHVCEVVTLCMLVQMECMICPNVHGEVLYMMVVFEFMLGAILPCLSLLQKCMWLLSDETCYVMLICLFHIFMCDFCLSYKSICFRSTIMSSLLWCNQFSMLCLVVIATILQNDLLVVGCFLTFVKNCLV